MLTGFSGKDQKVIEEAGKLTNEAIGNIRTVTSLSKQKHFTDAYSKKIDVPKNAAMRSAHFNGVLMGFSQSVMYYAIASAYTLGAYLIKNNLFGMDLERIMIVFGCIMFGGQSVGQASSLMPDYAKAKAAAVSIFELFDRKTQINNWESDEGLKMDSYESNLEIKSIEFTYPSRPTAKILNNLDLSIK